jgi:ankyrin repeat protein
VSYAVLAFAAACVSDDAERSCGELTLISSSLLPLHVRSGTVTQPPLCLALSQGKVDAARLLIEAGADINAPQT